MIEVEKRDVHSLYCFGHGMVLFIESVAQNNIRSLVARMPLAAMHRFGKHILSHLQGQSSARQYGTALGGDGASCFHLKGCPSQESRLVVRRETNWPVGEFVQAARFVSAR